MAALRQDLCPSVQRVAARRHYSMHDVIDNLVLPFP